MFGSLGLNPSVDTFYFMLKASSLIKRLMAVPDLKPEKFSWSGLETAIKQSLKCISNNDADKGNGMCLHTFFLLI